MSIEGLIRSFIASQAEGIERQIRIEEQLSQLHTEIREVRAKQQEFIDRFDKMDELEEAAIEEAERQALVAAATAGKDAHIAQLEARLNRITEQATKQKKAMVEDIHDRGAIGEDTLMELRTRAEQEAIALASRPSVGQRVVDIVEPHAPRLIGAIGALLGSLAALLAGLGAWMALAPTEHPTPPAIVRDAPAPVEPRSHP